MTVNAGISSIVNGIWIVENVTDAMNTLASHGVYPFKSKDAAKNFACNNMLTGFKYLKLPSYY
ncbi:hypothetical protein EIJ81_00280 (plasmid) [Aliivibrio salmonicida]|uniref:hypothetical protein n=1 Tax=Aliivibrio salmonicida TaxID=40269 RepID=UPI000F71E191|nr:hypothetical protein [Aliivibrio salmonicida]AZL83339.1 hypothetical protein EIJ81_00280 [Aliivibrio salmonicida]